MASPMGAMRTSPTRLGTSSGGSSLDRRPSAKAAARSRGLCQERAQLQNFDRKGLLVPVAREAAPWRSLTRSSAQRLRCCARES